MLAAPKTPQTLDFIDYRGVCPQSYSIFISPQSSMIATFLTNGSEAE